jgi:MIP family channel proteins
MFRNHINKAIAEAIGTFTIVLLGCGAIAVSTRFPGSIPAGIVPLVFGLAVATMIYAVGHISGAHFNPAVTLAFVLTRHFSWRNALTYWIAQFLGALLATAFLYAALPDGISYGAPVPSLSFSAALAWEMILTFFLMFVIIAVATDTRAVGIMAGAAIGATVTICAIVGGPLTGAALNPARAFAPALFEGNLNHMPIYILGPCLGAIIAALCYEKIRCEAIPNSDGKNPTKKSAKGCC